MPVQADLFAVGVEGDSRRDINVCKVSEVGGVLIGKLPEEARKR